MAGKIGQVTGQEVKTYKGVDNIRVLQVALFGGSPESVVYMNTSGEDTAPINGDMVIVRELGADKYTFGIRDPSLLVSEPGEKRIYSRNSAGEIVASVYLNKLGKFIAEKPLAGIVFDVFDHFHIGNLGFNTGPPVTGAGTAPPGNPPSIDGNNIVDGNGTKSTEHGHQYSWTDPAGSGTTGDAQ